jgi:hypothetical protein
MTEIRPTRRELMAEIERLRTRLAWDNQLRMSLSAELLLLQKQLELANTPPEDDYRPITEGYQPQANKSASGGGPLSPPTGGSSVVRPPVSTQTPSPAAPKPDV